MAQQDKTDWYWNGVLAGAVNNLYYDLINVDVVHVPYTTSHRNSSFFLQTRRAYVTANERDVNIDTHKERDVVDVKYIWDDTCSKREWEVYVLLADESRTQIRIHKARITDWCVWYFDWNRTRWNTFDTHWCGAFRLFTTSYVKWVYLNPWDIKEDTWTWEKDTTEYNWIQINKYEWWKTVWYFSDVNVENGSEKFIWKTWNQWFKLWDYILVYDVEHPGLDWYWFAWQVRMITWIEDGRLMVNTPWQWFKTLSWEDETDEVQGKWVKYYIFSDWWEVIWFTQGKRVYVMPDIDLAPIQVYNQTGYTSTNILSIAEAVDKIFILSDNWYIHYSNYTWYDKFFIQDDVYAWTDKTSIAAYRDIILAFWQRHIAVWIPDENNYYTTMYNQSSTVWLWSRYSYAEYDWDLIFVSNDKRLLALNIASNTWKYMLQYEDVWDAINSKLSILNPQDEVFLWNDNNDLRIFIQTKSKPYYNDDGDWQANLNTAPNNSMTRIFKFDKQFKVRTEDWVQWILLQWVEWWIYFWENWLYQRSRWTGRDWKWNSNFSKGFQWDSYPFKTYISAYLIENEGDWVWGTNSRLANRPKLYNVAKLNRIITTLWYGIYSVNSKIKITSYVKWLWTIYEFPLNTDTDENASRIWLVSNKYLWEDYSEAETKKLECLTSVLQDSQKEYQPKCVWEWVAAIHNLAQTQPWCSSYWELEVFDKWVCIDDSLYELSPTMPLTTSLWENQEYATQIKIELIWYQGDIITFGGRLWEMFIAPLFVTWPDWEYQLQPNTDC